MTYAQGRKAQLLLPLGTELKAAWKTTCDEIGLSQIKTGKRLVMWFNKQPREVQLRVLGVLPEKASPKRRSRTKRAKGG